MKETLNSGVSLSRYPLDVPQTIAASLDHDELRLTARECGNLSMPNLNETIS